MAVGDLRKIDVRHKHTRHWLWYVTAVSFMTGALLAVCLRTQKAWQQTFADPGDNRPIRLEVIAERLKAARDELLKQQEYIRQLNTEKSEYLSQMANRGHEERVLNDEREKYKVLLGLTEMKGPGIILTLKDSVLRSEAKTPEEIEPFVLHDYDLQRVVNELRVSGAEAVSINGQRVVERTAIRCVGPVAQVNNIPVSTPFVITAIGDPAVLRGGLTIQGGIVDWLKDLGFPADIVTPPGGVTVPAYDGRIDLRFAQPVPDVDVSPSAGKRGQDSPKEDVGQ